MRLGRLLIEALGRGWLAGLLPLLVSCVNLDPLAGAARAAASTPAASATSGTLAASAQPIKYSGRKVFTDHGCFVCHGEGRQGTRYGPSLAQVKDRWTREELRKFLKDAIGYAKAAPRIGELAGHYPMPMRRFEMMSEGERESVMDYLLGQ